MRYSLAVLALAVAVQASPFAFPGGVTSAIAPSAKPPPGCTPSHASFGIAVLNITTAAKQKRQVSTISDGQPQAPTSAAIVSTISDGQPQAPKTSLAPVSTACAASQIVDGQPQACTSTMKTIAHISQITDGQVQGGMHTVTIMPVSQISDGQPQGPTVTYMPVSVISDGQPQAPKLPTKTACAASQIVDGQPQAGCTVTACAASQIVDGQPQAGCTVTACAASQIVDGQPQAGCTTTATACAASQIIDGQPQNGCTITSTAKPVSTISEGQPQAPTAVVSATSSAPAAAGTPYELVACRTNSSLEVSLSNGILTDSDGRTGYIAANYQFQFDKPPQAGAIYTAGFSVCANGSLALGGSNVFWQCLSGNFYNLYDRYWAAQCSPITIESLTLITC